MVLAILFFAAGLLGTLLPILPGAVLVYAGMLLYGLLTRFVSLDLTFFLLQGLVLLLTILIDVAASAVGTRRYQGSRMAAWGAAIGTLAGLFLLGPLGLVAGPFLGAVAAEMLQGKEPAQAFRVGYGTLIGVLGGTLLKLMAETVMILGFFIRIF